ncbi:hypothetical protein MWU57_10845 [Isoptericola sp. S6320L]|uniref:hypothetical protein n=1 Tax=Isoptericola sp. S6320L TaxID=2926411 RepID=UPI001FF26327|nr:hypothetical protein [Isoptericola sp. S6320L]MCK0117528.1 hypothetical protein [Isoptericola sp. S6320L]
MLWWGAVLVVLGVALAARSVWTARRGSTGAHGLLIAVGVGLVFWGLVLGVVAAVRA